MKRYNIHAPANSQYEEAPDGEWVEYEEVSAELERLRRRDSEDWPALADLGVAAYKARLATATELLATLRAADAESRLATAITWIGQLAAHIETDPCTDLDILDDLTGPARAFIANQPAAHSWCEKCHSAKPCPGCTIPAAPDPLEKPAVGK